MFIGLAQKAKYVKFLVNDHSPTILTGVGVAGTVATAYLTGRASFKAARLIDQEQKENPKFELVEMSDGNATQVQKNLSKTEKAKLVWKLYLPPVGTGAITVTSIIAANKISSKRLAALVVASGISERALQEYKDKVIEKWGPNQDRAVRDEVAADRIKNHPPKSGEVIVVGTGDVLFYDMSSGRYFQSTMEKVRKAENRINYELIHYMSASLSMFYEEIGLPPTSYSDSVGWNMDHHIEVDFSTSLTDDDKPCIAIDFKRQPRADYDKTAWNT